MVCQTSWTCKRYCFHRYEQCASVWLRRVHRSSVSYTRSKHRRSPVSSYSPTAHCTLWSYENHARCCPNHCGFFDPCASVHESTPARVARSWPYSSRFHDAHLAVQQKLLVLHYDEHNSRFWLFYPIDLAAEYAQFTYPSDTLSLISNATAFASSLGLTTAQSSLALTLIYGASILAGCTMGYLSDRFDIWLLAIFSLITTCLATFFVWGLWAHSLAGILAFGVVYGSTAGSWSSMWYGFVTPVASAHRICLCVADTFIYI